MPCLLAAMAPRENPLSRAGRLRLCGQPFQFGGHMWTEVFVDGRWIPIDGTLAAWHWSGPTSEFADSASPTTGRRRWELPLLGTVLGRSRSTVRDIAYARDDPQSGRGMSCF